MRRSILGLFLCVCVISGCQEPFQVIDGRPNRLRIGYTPPEENVELVRIKLGKFTDYLSRKLDMPVSLVKLRGYAPMIEALKSNKIDIASLGSFAFVIAEKRANVEPMIMRGHKDTGDGIYHSVILTTRPHLNSMEDVKKHCKDLKLTLGNPASTSGHLIPRAYMEKIGLHPQKDFKELIHCPEHTASLMSVLSGSVDLVGMNENTLLKYIEKGYLSEGDVKILWKSDPIPTGPIVIRKVLPKAFRKEVQQVYLDVMDEEPEIWKTVRGSTNENIIYWPADLAKWDIIRGLAEKLRNEMYGVAP